MVLPTLSLENEEVSSVFVWMVSVVQIFKVEHGSTILKLHGVFQPLLSSEMNALHPLQFLKMSSPICSCLE